MAKLKDGFYKLTAEALGSNSYMLLAGGGSKALSDFATASGVVTALGTNGNYVTWTKNGTVNNLTVPYSTNADTVDNKHASDFIQTSGQIISGKGGKLAGYHQENGWHRIATIDTSSSYGYGSHILYLTGTYNYAQNTNAIIHINTMDTTGKITQVSGCVGFANKIRLVNVSSNKFYVDVHINYTDNTSSSSDTPGTVYYYFLGNGSVTINALVEKITDTVTAASEVTLVNTEGNVLTSGNYTNWINTTNFPGLNKVGTVTSVTVTGANGLSGSGTVTSSGTITLSNSGVRSTTINGNYLRVNTNGTNADLTIPYATNANTATTISGFTKRATGNCTWGTLTSSNGYTPVYWGDTASNGGIGFSDKDDKTYMQIDGDYYAQEGTKLVLHTGNYTSYVNTTNFPGLNSVGDITGVTAGNGLTGGGTSGSVTLNVGAGTGISVTADTVGINSTYQTYISNGNTAYGWGNHANAGYLTRRKATISPEGNAEGWYRTLQFTSNSYSVSNFILSIQRSYNSPQNEHYIFAISVGYNGDVSISQLSGVDGVLLITKIRVVYTNSAAGYFDFYIKSNLNGSTSYKNTYTIELYAGDGALQTPEIVTSAGGTVVEFTPTNGIKSNLGFTGNFIGNLTGNVTGNVSGSSGSCTGNAATATSLATTTIVSSKSLTLKNTEWTDTGYTFASLTTGTYAVQITSGSNLVASGIMSVYENLADTVGDEIPLHVYGTATWRPYLRTYNNKLLISSTDVPSANGTGTSRTVTIKIARII